MTVTQTSASSTSDQPTNQPSANPKPAVRLLLICHAEGMHDRYLNLANENSGLTAVGWEQSDVLASWLRLHELIDVLVTDPLLQSRLTAQRIGQALTLPVTVYSEFPNCPRERWRLPAVEQGASKLLADWGARAPTVATEAYDQYRRMLVDALDKLLIEHWGNTIALVTCGDGIATLIRHLTGTFQLVLQLDHTSLTEICYQQSHWRVNYVNRRPHLPVPLVSPREIREELVAAEGIEDVTSVIQVYNRVRDGGLDRKREDDRNRIRHLLNFAKLSSALKLLDVGTGIGILPLMLAEDGADSVVGIDVSPAMLELAEYQRLSKPSASTQKVSYRLAPAQSLPFHDERFDGVICRLVLHHARKPERIIKEVVRVLKPGGILILAELLSVDNPVKRATQNAIEERRNPSHIAAHSAEHYNKLITDAGLVIEAKDTVSFDRELEEWLTAYKTDRADATIVREMIEAGLETDAAGINARRQGNTLVFEQRMYYVKAIKP